MPLAVGISAPQGMSRKVLAGSTATRPARQAHWQVSRVDRFSSSSVGGRTSPNAVLRSVQEGVEDDNLSENDEHDDASNILEFVE